MLHHRTDDPGFRAMHIAEREANEYLHRTHDIDSYFNVMLAVNEEALHELQTLPPRKAKRFHGRLFFCKAVLQFF